MSKYAFAMPSTPKIEVEYVKMGVKYSAIIPNPKDNTGLASTMWATRKVSMGQIKNVNPFTPKVARV